MKPLVVDVVVFGSSFSGCLMALILRRIGLDVVVVDRAAHPRFAIGESSTPIANAILRDLARRYDLPQLDPLSRYGSWKNAYPLVGVGLKRGFAYFQHRAGQPFQPDALHTNELLVTASASDELGDTQWFRADVDALFAAQLRDERIRLFEQADTASIHRTKQWEIELETGDGPVPIRAAFVVDASGAGGAIARHVGLRNRCDQLQTNSRAIFSHFRGVPHWHDRLVESGAVVRDHPFRCDHAAVHQLLDGAWMWMLRFDDGRLSAGLAMDAQRFPLDDAVPPDTEWRHWLDRYPSLDELFSSAEVLEPPARLVRTARLQRCSDPIAGPGWTLLPNTAGFIDPLHSTGIAHSMCGIERLAHIFETAWGTRELETMIQGHAAVTARELEFIDRLVAACYTALGDSRLIEACTMLYFAAATTYEHRRHESAADFASALLCADDPALFGAVHSALDRVRTARRTGDIAGFEAFVRDAIGPYNRVGLCEPAANGMYRYTTAPS